MEASNPVLLREVALIADKGVIQIPENLADVPDGRPQREGEAMLAGSDVTEQRNGFPCTPFHFISFL